LLAWLPLFLTKSRGFSIPEMTFLATLVGLALLAGSGSGDIRDFGLAVRQAPAKGMMGRLIQAMKGSGA
jgi:hypothetical protein